MRQNGRLLLGALAILLLASCGDMAVDPKRGEKTAEQKTNGGKATEPAADGSKGEAAQEREKLLDTMAIGGQPGQIVLEGALVAQLKVESDLVTLHPATGIGWRGHNADIQSDAVVLNAEVSEKARKELEQIKNDTSFINIGCAIQGREETKGLSERVFSPVNPDMSLVKAKVVYICGQQPFKSKVTQITADVVVLFDFEHEMTGTPELSFSLTARELILEGENSLSSKATDGPLTTVAGPSISISAVNLSEKSAQSTKNRSILIKSEGANYNDRAE